MPQVLVVRQEQMRQVPVVRLRLQVQVQVLVSRAVPQRVWVR